MSEITEQILAAQGGLNYDDDPRFFAKGDTEYRLNVIPSALGDTYVLTNLKGTTKKEHSFSHDATYDGAVYTALGSCYDVKRNAVNFFIYSDANNHCILRYRIDNDEFEKIVWDNENIGLDINYSIHDAFMIDDWLFWNPRSSSPRSINVQWAYYDHTVDDIEDQSTGFFYSIGDLFKYKNRVYEVKKAATVTTINFNKEKSNYWEVISWTYDDVRDASTRQRYFYHTTPPLRAKIISEIESDTDYEANHVRGRVFQFTYRYYIPELGYTPTAPISSVIATFSGETYSGEFPGEVTTNNNIKFTLYPLMEVGTASYSWIFDYVEILVRDAENPAWRTVVQIPHTKFVLDGPTTNTYNFYNDERLTAVDDAAIEVSYNYLPRLSNAQWSLDGERVAYGGNTEGLDVPRTDVSFTSYDNEIDYVTGDFTPASQEDTISFTETRTYDLNDPSQTDIYYYTSETISLGTAAAGDVLVATIDGMEYSTVLTASDDDDIDAYVDAIQRVLSQGNMRTVEIAGPKLETNDYPEERHIALLRFTPENFTENTKAIKYKTFKSGAWHRLCLFYYDELMRRSEAVPLDPIYINNLPETTNSAGTGIRHYLSYSISHDPPDYATAWKFGYAGNSSIGDFWQYVIAGAGLIDNAGSVWNDLSYVDISPLQGIKDDSSYTYNFSNSTIETYTFEQGDRIRFLTKKDTGAEDNSEMDIDDWATGNPHDYEIVDYDSATNYIYFNSDGVIGDTTSGDEIDYDDTSVLVEIYRPKKAVDDEVYYEIGSINSITGSGNTRAHDNAAGIITDGDCYLITRVMVTAPSNFSHSFNPVFVESYSWSDFYKSEMWGKGKAGSSFDMGERELNTVRYSNKFIKNTRSAGLGRFDGLDYITVSYSYGDITAMRQVGGVFKVLFENNVASVFVNKTQYYDAIGQSQVVLSDNVLGGINYSEEAWGTVNPESVLVVDRDLYFFDLRRKAYIRNAPNGSFPISDYKMRKYFVDKSDDLLTSGEGNFQVYSAWDDDHDLVYVGFNDDVNTSNSDYVLFHYASNRWVSFHSTAPASSYNRISIDDDAIETANDDDIAIELSSSQSGGTYTSTLIVTQADGSGAYNDDLAFDASQTISLFSGDTVEIYVEHQSGDASLQGVTEFRITGTGSVANVVQDIYATDGDAYTNTINITEDSTIQVSIAVDGSTTVAETETQEFDWYVLITTQSSVPIMYGAPSNLISLYGEDMYLHNNNDTYCNLFGVQRDYSVRIYGGIEAPNIVKTFDSIALHTNAYWDGEDVQIPATLNYPNGMESRLPEARFEKEEGVLRSDYLCNMKTTSSSATTIDLFNGDALRGYTIYQDFVGDETTKHTLYKVDINMSQSKY